VQGTFCSICKHAELGSARNWGQCSKSFNSLFENEQLEEANRLWGLRGRVCLPPPHWICGSSQGARGVKLFPSLRVV
jgi:hypothetical protein